MFTPKTAYQNSTRSVDGVRFTADAEFKGENRPQGGRITIYVKPAEKKDTAKVETKEVSILLLQDERA